MNKYEVIQSDRDLAAKISAIFDEGHPIVAIVANIARMVAAHRLQPPVAPGEQPPRNPYAEKFCGKCGKWKDVCICVPPAQERASDERERPIREMPMVTPEQALESLNEFTRFWHRIGGDQGDAPDAHLTRRFIKQQTDALATAAKQAREEALEEAARYLETVGPTSRQHHINTIRALAAQPSPQTKEEEK